jgi:hypothetical protein
VINDFSRLYVWDHHRFIPFLHDEILKLAAYDADYGAGIFAIHTDRENSMWIGGEQGLIRYKDGSVTRFTSADGLAGIVLYHFLSLMRADCADAHSRQTKTCRPISIV